MTKEMTVKVNRPNGEEGLSLACREGILFRNDPQLEELYKDGYRIYNYSILDEERSQESSTTVKVFLKK